MTDTHAHTSTRRGVLRSVATGGTVALGLGAVGQTRADDGRNPVLLVHGYSDTGATPWWEVLEGYLRDVGYDSSDIYVLSFGDIPGTTTDSPSEYGRVVARNLDRIAESTGRDVDIISHSMGGLGSRWAIEKDGADDRVDDLVTLGTPHQGTYAAYVGLLTPGGRDMIEIASAYLRLQAQVER